MNTSDRPAGTSGQLSRLWVFDFDWTVVDENSDTWIHRCAPGASLPPHIKDSYISPDWVGYMNRVLSYLAAQGVTHTDVRSQLQAIPWTPGMRQLLEAIGHSGAPEAPAAAAKAKDSETPAVGTATKGAASGHHQESGSKDAEEGTSGRPKLRGAQHAVILSDANSLFITWILGGGSRDGAEGSPASVPTATASEAAAPADADCGTSGRHQTQQPPLVPMFMRILTNPAAVDPATGATVVTPYNGSGPGSLALPHKCTRCNPNLCKREVLRKLLDEQAAAGVSYRQVVYVGDGRNDLCPCLELRRGDVAMPRVGFALHKLLRPLAVKAAAASGTTVSGAVADGARGDDHIYGAALDGTQAQGRGSAAARGEPSADVLRAACVPWSDAYDILRWVGQQDDQDDLAARAGVLVL